MARAAQAPRNDYEILQLSRLAFTARTPLLIHPKAVCISRNRKSKQEAKQMNPRLNLPHERLNKPKKDILKKKILCNIAFG